MTKPKKDLTEGSAQFTPPPQAAADKAAADKAAADKAAADKAAADKAAADKASADKAAADKDDVPFRTKRAREVFASHAVGKVYFTADDECFINEQFAVLHGQSLKEQSVKTVTREEAE